MRMSGLEELKSREREVDFLLGGTRFREDWDWLIQQAERVQELEKEIENWRKEVKKWQRFFREEAQQNERYREYLELIRITGTHGKDIETGEIIRSDEANLAEEALEDEE